MPRFSLALAAALCLSACGATLTSDHMICEFKDSAGEYSQCGDWKNVAVQYRSTIAAACSSFHRFSTGDCPTENRLAGCFKDSGEEGQGTLWFYRSQKYPNVSSTLKDCEAEKTWVSPSGTPADRGNGQCTPASASGTLVATVMNKTAATLSIFRRDSTCTEVFQDSVDAMGIRGFGCKKDEVLVLRAGSNDAFGKILKEHVCTASGTVTVQ
jgi:hypothetical protein